MRAIAQPLRRQILRVLRASATSVSVRRIEGRLALSGLPGESLGNVSYHVRTLAKYKVIRGVRERQVRGAIEHFYVSCVDAVPWLEGVLSDTRESDEAWLRSKRERQGDRRSADGKAA